MYLLYPNVFPALDWRGECSLWRAVRLQTSVWAGFVSCACMAAWCLVWAVYTWCTLFFWSTHRWFCAMPQVLFQSCTPLPCIDFSLPVSLQYRLQISHFETGTTLQYVYRTGVLVRFPRGAPDGSARVVHCIRGQPWWCTFHSAWYPYLHILWNVAHVCGILFKTESKGKNSFWKPTKAGVYS